MYNYYIRIKIKFLFIRRFFKCFILGEEKMSVTNGKKGLKAKLVLNKILIFLGCSYWAMA